MITCLWNTSDIAKLTNIVKGKEYNEASQRQCPQKRREECCGFSRCHTCTIVTRPKVCYRWAVGGHNTSHSIKISFILFAVSPSQWFDKNKNIISDSIDVELLWKSLQFKWFILKNNNLKCEEFGKTQSVSKIVFLLSRTRLILFKTADKLEQTLGNLF